MIPRRTLMALVKGRELSQSELARLAGVSRQAVSLWMRGSPDGVVPLRSRHWLRLSRTLGVGLEELAGAWPDLRPEERRAQEAALLWDRLYPGLDDMAAALCRGEPRALARLVEVQGLYAAARAAGPQVWRRFPEYKTRLHPARREGLERVWRIETGRASK